MYLALLFFFKTALLRHNSHAIKSCFSIFNSFYVYHHDLILEFSCSLSKKPISSHSPFPPLVVPGSHWFTFCLDFPILDISYLWNHARCSLFCLTSLIFGMTFSRFSHVIASISTSFSFNAKRMALIHST